MRIDFKAMEETVIPHFKGGEKAIAAQMYADGANKIMKGRLIPGASIGMHTHDTGSEILYILAGEGTALCDGTAERLTRGDCHYCPKGHTHTLMNDGVEELVFFAVVPEQ